MTENYMLRSKFSLIVPVFNREHIISEVLEHIFKIDYLNFEVIVVDDSSTDQTIELVRKYPCKILQNNNNTGVSSGRNRGAKIANGEFLVFVDSDMILPPNILKTFEKVFAQDNCKAVIIPLYTPAIRFKNFASNYKNLYWHYMFDRLPDSVNNFMSVAAIRRDIFWEVGGYDEKFGKSPLEDQEFGMRIAAKYRIELCKEIQIEHVKHYKWLDVLLTGLQRAECTLKLMFRTRFNNAEKMTPPTGFRWGIILTGLQTLFIILGILVPSTLTYANSGTAMVLDSGYNHFWLLAVSCFVIINIINIRFLGFMLREKGWWFLFRGCLFINFELFFMGLGVIKGLFSYVKGAKY